MKAKFINEENIEGRIFNHTLELKTVKSQGKNYGKEFIQGELRIQVDEKGLNVIPINYQYVPPVWNSGKENGNFKILKKIIEENPTVESVGFKDAMIVRCNPNLNLNDYYSLNKDEMGSYMENSGGFITVINEDDLRTRDYEANKFKVEGVAVKVTEVEEDPEREIPYHVDVRLGIFDFRKNFMPVTLKAYSEGAIQWALGANISNSNPVFLTAWGEIKNTSIKKEIVEESDFGEDSVRTVTRNLREWVIRGGNSTKMMFGTEDTITAEELKKCLSDREIALANIKKARLEYEASKNDTPNEFEVATKKNSSNDDEEEKFDF